eukprot:CAMPEP_0181238652 /NCGR_PEP_ID=MMETSP1096-20121128/39474_1 /TAXON_ID=156174 ORGANISM="Chrysochromulina ericina, Strain CCMP281" /NCGR_SAMPLE_ID=MMETSP1096 /ASSEMBLY_ACC=CAM_ASM_000453 /LENGTH=213 /DNA_ID=CAMNT_0023334215 /DNA_START=80 /DNA_END=721 /DNA_ORIENTATION=+
MPMLLQTLGLGDRIVGFDGSLGSMTTADAVTIAPTYTDHSSVMAKLALKSALALVEKSAIGRPKVPQTAIAPRPYVLLVRRDPGAKSKRAVLNHAELYTSLRKAFPKNDIVEFPPETLPMSRVIPLWRRASLVIAPHGAGMANAYFVNPSATVVELVRKGQQGRVYRQVTHAAGARYVECLYDYDVTATATTNFLVDLRWLKGCLSAHNVTPS